MTAGNSRASVAWTAPAFGSAPFTYTVTSSPEGATCVVTDLTAVCSGLTNFISYTFTVTATNEFGSAVSSDSIAVEGVDQDWFVEAGDGVTCNNLGTEADPLQSVQCAIDAASTGDTIRVAAGEYDGFAVDKALTIVGPNDEVAPGPESSREAEAVITSSVSIASGVDGVTLSGFSLSPSTPGGVGVNIGSNSRNVTITYNEITGFDQGIRSAGNDANFGSDMDVSYNYIHGLSLAASGSYSIHLRNVKNVTVSHNIVTDSVTDPVLTGSQMRRGILLRGTQDAVVSNNVVDFGSVASTKSYYAISIARLLNDGVNGNDLAVTNLDITDNTLSGAVNGINFLDLGAQATDVLIEGNTARNVFVGVSFRSFGQSGATVQELLVQKNDFSDIDSASGVLSAGVQVFSIDFTQPALNEFDGVVVNGNKLPSNEINQLTEINGLLVGAINPFAPGFPNVLTFYSQDITDLDARANYWGGDVPTTDVTRQANVAGSILAGSFSNDPSKAGQPGFWPLSSDANLSGLSLSAGTLSPEFAADTTTYTARVHASITSFTVTPTTSDDNASVAQYLGASGTTPFTGELGGRETAIRVVVTAEDGTVKTSRVTVTRFNFTPQNVTFTPVGSIAATTPVYSLTASASSGLPVTFTSTTTEICTVSGTVLSTVKAGLCLITAAQAGNDTYSPASINKSIMITRVAQRITLFNPTNMTTLSSAQTLSATKGLGTAPVTFSTTSSGVCSIDGTSLTVIAAGTCVVTASQAADDKYVATSVMKSVTIEKAAQSITLFNPTNMTTLSSAQTLSATKGPGTAPVTFSTNSSGVCSIDGTSLTVVAAGTCVVTASQAADDRYAAARNVTKTITISKAAQTITFTPVDSLSATAPSYTLTATAGSGLTVGFTSTTPLICTVSGTTLTPVKAGSCSVTASQVGNATYNSATNVSKSITISLVSQATLTVANSTRFAFAKGVPVTLTSEGGSGVGNAVSFSVRGTGCSISSGALSVARTTRPGSLVTCSVTATRAGNEIYLPTTSVAKTFFFQNR